MSKLWQNVLGYVLFPGLTLGYYLTQHTAFLFFIGALSVFITVVVGLAMLVVALVIAKKGSGDLTSDIGIIEAIYRYKTQPFWRKAFIYTTWLGIISALAYWGAFVTLALYLVQIVVTLVIASFLESIAKQIEKFAVEENMTVKELIDKLKQEKLETAGMTDAQKLLRDLQIERLREKSR